jgi:DNA-binding CsgD family transcriptional regulator
MESGKKGLPILSGVGIASLLAAQFVIFLEGRGLGIVSFSLQNAAAGFCGGIILGGLLFSTWLPKRFGSPCALALTLLSALLWAVGIFQNNDIFSYGACFWGGAVLPPLLKSFFSRSSSPGFHMGIAFAAGDFFWLFLYIAPLSDAAVQWLLLCLQFISGSMAAICLFKEQPTAEGVEIVRKSDRLTSISLRYLTIIAFIFFLLNAFIDITFYRIHSQAFPIPAQVHLYTWLAYPIVGLLIDKYGTDMRLLLVCIGGVILSPTLVVITEGTLIYWLIYVIDLVCRGIAQLYFLLVFAQIGRQSPRRGLISAIPYVAMLMSFLCVYRFVEHFPGTVPIAFWCLFLTTAFSYVSSRIQYALTLSGVSKTPSADKQGIQEFAPFRSPEPHKNERCRADSVADFALKYGISLRERDVLCLILEGCDTTAICDQLHISENTLKTHIRQILRKTETRNRNALLVLFFNEENLEKEAAPLESFQQC